MQLIRLKKIKLQKSTKVKQDNGTKKETYQNISDYYVITEELVDSVSASIYGADLNKTLRVRSNFGKLESTLITKVNNTNDNVSMYFILLNNTRYKIVSVKENWVDISL